MRMALFVHTLIAVYVFLGSEVLCQTQYGRNISLSEMIDKAARRLSLISCGHSGLMHQCESECQKDILGVDYKGQVAVTRSGKTCQAWASQSPHKHTKGSKSSDFLKTGETLQNVKNYCRNPEAWEGGPWCYTTDPNTRYESCDIKRCIDEKHIELDTDCLPDSSGKSNELLTFVKQLKKLACGNKKLGYSCFVGHSRLSSCSCRSDRRGFTYKGRVSKSSTGKTCQAWASQSPHKHEMAKKIANFPEGSLEKAKNYCRSPTKWEGGLWCYTTDPNKRWESCDVPSCVKDMVSLVHPVWKDEGRAEIKDGGRWGTICDSRPRIYEGGWPSLFCRLLGYNRATVARHVHVFERKRTGLIRAMSPICGNDAKSLSECDLRGKPCTHEQDVYIKCAD